jgi:hypothetical protein
VVLCVCVPLDLLCFTEVACFSEAALSWACAGTYGDSSMRHAAPSASCAPQPIFAHAHLSTPPAPTCCIWKDDEQAARLAPAVPAASAVLEQALLGFFADECMPEWLLKHLPAERQLTFVELQRRDTTAQVQVCEHDTRSSRNSELDDNDTPCEPQTQPDDLLDDYRGAKVQMSSSGGDGAKMNALADSQIPGTSSSDAGNMPSSGTKDSVTGAAIRHPASAAAMQDERHAAESCRQLQAPAIAQFCEFVLEKCVLGVLQAAVEEES